MKREHIIRMFAGTLILIGIALHIYVNRWWLLLPALVGANLFQSSLTRWCLLEDILRKYNIGAA
jgi:hypothetical protein